MTKVVPERLNLGRWAVVVLSRQCSESLTTLPSIPVSEYQFGFPYYAVQETLSFLTSPISPAIHLNHNLWFKLCFQRLAEGFLAVSSKPRKQASVGLIGNDEYLWLWGSSVAGFRRDPTFVFCTQ